MIARLLALLSRLFDRLFSREETEAEWRDRFYNGHEEARRWERISTRATGARMLDISRHGL